MEKQFRITKRDYLILQAMFLNIEDYISECMRTSNKEDKCILVTLEIEEINVTNKLSNEEN